MEQSSNALRIQLVQIQAEIDSRAEAAITLRFHDSVEVSAVDEWNPELEDFRNQRDTYPGRKSNGSGIAECSDVVEAENIRI